jgi:hypothetical protein
MVLQKLQRKIEKNRKRKRKGVKRPGKPFGPEEELAHGPASPRSRTGNLSLSFSR